MENDRFMKLAWWATHSQQEEYIENSKWNELKYWKINEQ